MTCAYAYDDCGVPAHFQVLDAGDIAPADRLFFYKAGFGAGSPAGFTNYFRYTLLERSDTIWIDADVLCLSRDWPVQTAVLAAWEDADHINGAVLGLPRSAAFLPGGGGEIRQGHRLGASGTLPPHAGSRRIRPHILGFRARRFLSHSL
jgi:hypothetical protein